MRKSRVNGALTALAIVLASAACSGPTAAAIADRPVETAERRVVAASPGRVEGASESVNLGPGIEGVIKEVRVAAGQRVARGQIIAVIDRDDLEHDVQAAGAAVDRARSRKIRLLRGAREESRRQAAEDTNAAAAVLADARLRLARTDALARAGAAPVSDRDQAQRDLDVAEARLQSTQQTSILANAPPLPEEVRQADAEIAEAEANLAGARARHGHGQIVAPHDGTILKVHARAGESVTPLNVGQPVVTLADLSRLRVRAEVDERDVPRVALGQAADVELADVHAAAGRVVWLAPVMGRRNTSTGDPAEKADRDVREVLIELDGSPALVIDQRVTVRFSALEHK